MQTLFRCEATAKLRSLRGDEALLPVVRKHVATHHSPQNLFELVDDIKRYPEFIPWIKAMRISGEKTEGDEAHKLGEALVGFKGFTESFSTKVVSRKSTFSVDVTLVRGPFRRLKNTWKFVPSDNSQTTIDFYIDYAFSNPILSMLARSNTDSAIEGIMNAFIAEANKRYDSPTPPPPLTS